MLCAFAILPVPVTRNSHLTFRIHLIAPPPLLQLLRLLFLIVEVEAVMILPNYFLPVNLFHARRTPCLELCVVLYLLFVSSTQFGDVLILSYLSAAAAAAATTTITTTTTTTYYYHHRDCYYA